MVKTTDLLDGQDQSANPFSEQATIDERFSLEDANGTMQSTSLGCTNSGLSCNATGPTAIPRNRRISVMVTGAGPRDGTRLEMATRFGADLVVDVLAADPVRAEGPAGGAPGPPCAARAA